MLDGEPGAATAACGGEGGLGALPPGAPGSRRPPSSWYAARKFAARNRLGVTVTGLSVIALVSLTAVSGARIGRGAGPGRARAQRVQPVSPRTRFFRQFVLAQSAAREAAMRFSSPTSWITPAAVGHGTGRRSRGGSRVGATRSASPTACSGERPRAKRQQRLGLKALARIFRRLSFLGWPANIYGKPVPIPSTFRAASQTRLFRMPPEPGDCRAAGLDCLGGALHDTPHDGKRPAKPLPEARGCIGSLVAHA